MLAYRRDLYLNEADNAVTFTVDLAAKDMNAALALAAASGCDMPQGRVTTQRLHAAQAQGLGARDMAAMLAFARKEPI